jgi:hypothetical protein
MDGSTTGTAFRVLRNLGFRDLYRFSEMKQFVIPDAKWFIRHPRWDAVFS